MQLNRTLDQHTAVFGESGSGKTVLLSSFYGATQEPQYLKSSLFHVVADDAGQGNQLYKNYLGMRDAARVPETNRFKSTSYAFSVKLKNGNGKAKKARPFDAVRLFWHDYPGEWFEQDVSGPEEGQRRLDTFRSLMGSDVALLLVDGQKLLDNVGEEDRYLKSLLSNFRNGLLRLEGDLLEDGKLVKFPRIWMLALSKADLLPGFDVFTFRDLLIAKAADELEELREVLAGLVESPEALAVGEDFVLLSSAKFEPDGIHVTDRVGLDLILPLAAMLPFERHVKWAEQKQLGAKVVEELLIGTGALADALLGKAKFAGPKAFVASKLGRRMVTAMMTAAAGMGGEQLSKLHADAMARRDDLAAVLTGFQLDLDHGEEMRVLLRSPR